MRNRWHTRWANKRWQLEYPAQRNLEESNPRILREWNALYVTGDKGVMIYSPKAQHIRLIPVPEEPANMKFGGKENRTLF